MEAAKASADYAVFEIVNASLKEIFVGVAPVEALHQVPLRLPANAPLLHWGLSGPEPARPLEVRLTEGAARAFVEIYVRTSLPNGWRFLT